MAVFYRPPGDIDDYDQRPPETAAALKQDWHDFIAGAIANRDEGLFYDAFTDTSPGQASNPEGITWNAFPDAIWQWFNAESDPGGVAKALKTAEILRPAMFFISPQGRLGNALPSELGNNPMRRVINDQLADPVFIQHRQQDEYCEWHVDRDDNQRIRRVSFTAEGPEYWRRMAAIDFDGLVDLYQTHVNPSVMPDDLKWPFDVAIPDFQAGVYRLFFQKGEYNPYNPWNTAKGAMHLTHPSNTLGAEINLAADGTILRPSVPIQPAATFRYRLVCCGIPAGVNRSSDPFIAAGVNGIVQTGRAATLANPIGLYISSVDVDLLVDPDGKEIGLQALSVPRGSPDGRMTLRAELKPPDGASFTLDGCRLEGDLITTGGQIARKITMILFGQSKSIPGRTGVSQACQAICCRKPDAPNVRLVVGVGTQCDQLDPSEFEAEAPFEGDSQDNALVAPQAGLAPAATLALSADAAPPPAATRRLAAASSLRGRD